MIYCDFVIGDCVGVDDVEVVWFQMFGEYYQVLFVVYEVGEVFLCCVVQFDIVEVGYVVFDLVEGCVLVVVCEDQCGEFVFVCFGVYGIGYGQGLWVVQYVQ